MAASLQLGAPRRGELRTLRLSRVAIAVPNFFSSLAWVPPAIALAWMGALAAADKLGTIAYASPLLVAAGVILAFTFLKATQGRPYAIATILVLVLLLTDAKFEVSRETFEATWQSVMKVAVWAALVGLACLRWRSVARILRKPEIILLFAYATIALVSALWSEVPAFSGAAAVGLFAYGALACIVVIDLREETAIRLFVWALLAFVCAGITCAAVAPDFAWLPVSLDESGSGYRLQGFASHPNVLGQITAIMILMAVTARRKALIGRVTFYSSLGFGVASLLATGSRTALVAILTAWGLVASRNSRIGGAVAIAGLGVMSLVLVLAACDALPNIEGLFGKLSRTGSESEILTLTGRTDVWDIVWTQIMQKPFFGWGYYGTEQLITSGLDPIFKVQAKHAHNMFLQSILSVGFLGSLPGFAYILLLTSRFVTHPDPTRDQITLFILVTGFSEADVFGLPAAATLIFYWVLAREAAKRLPVAGASSEPAVKARPVHHLARRKQGAELL
jgi:O-antigen ligase